MTVPLAVDNRQLPLDNLPMDWFKRFGPGLLVTAAFIGPGTVTTCTIAGASFGFSLLWVVLFATVATIILQEMSARLGIVARKGLGESLRESFPNPTLRTAVVVLVVGAIAFGNAAFQWGNINGTAMGLEVITGISRPMWSIITGIAATALLFTGTYASIELILIALVVVMSVVFILTAAMVQPDLGEMVRGLLTPQLPQGSLTTAIALIGTTVVPYNLFLHASSVREKWPASMPTEQALGESRVDTVLSISLGGLLTLAIVITAAAFFRQGTTLDNAASMAQQLEPLLGPAAKWCFAIGLMAAGFTSALTAPLAAAYATAGTLGWPIDLRSWKFRAVWFGVVLAGTFAAAIGRKPVSAIIFAQAANGFILPVIAVFLLMVMNRRALLGDHVNGIAANVLGVIVVAVATALGVYKIVEVFV
jgi:manganese transport protein